MQLDDNEYNNFLDSSFKKEEEQEITPTPLDYGQDMLSPYQEETGFITDVGRSVGRGVAGMGVLAGNALERVGISNPIDDYFQDRIKNYYRPDVSEYADTESWAKKAVTGAAEMIPLTAGIIASSIVGGPVGAFAALATVGAGVDQASQEEYLKVHPGDISGAKEYGFKQGLSETLSELVTDFTPLAFMKVFKYSGLSKAGPKAISDVLKKMTKKEIASMGLATFGTEVTSEAANAYYQTTESNKAGISDVDPWSSVAEVIGPTAIISTLFSIGTVGITNKNRASLRSALVAGNPEQKMQAAEVLREQLEKKSGKETAELWFSNYKEMTDKGIKVDLNESFDKLADRVAEEVRLADPEAYAKAFEETGYYEGFKVPELNQDSIYNTKLNDIKSKPLSELEGVGAEIQGLLDKKSITPSHAEGLRQVLNNKAIQQLTSKDPKEAQAAIDLSFKSAGINRSTGVIEVEPIAVGAPVDQRITRELKSRERMRTEATAKLQEAGLISPGQSLDDALAYLGYEPTPATEPTPGQRIAQYNTGLKLEREGLQKQAGLRGKQEVQATAMSEAQDAMRTIPKPTAEEIQQEVQEEGQELTPANIEELNKIRESIVQLEEKKKGKEETIVSLKVERNSLKTEASKTTKLTERKKLNSKAKDLDVEIKKEERATRVIVQEVKKKEKEVAKLVPASNIGDTTPVAPTSQEVIKRGTKVQLEGTTEGPTTYVSEGENVAPTTFSRETSKVAEGEDLRAEDLAVETGVEVQGREGVAGILKKDAVVSEMSEPEVEAQLRLKAEKEGKSTSEVKDSLKGEATKGTDEYSNPVVSAFVQEDKEGLYALAKEEQKELLRQAKEEGRTTKSGAPVSSISMKQAMESLYNKALQDTEIRKEEAQDRIEYAEGMIKEVVALDRELSGKDKKKNKVEWEPIEEGANDFVIAGKHEESGDKYILAAQEVPVTDKEGNFIEDEETGELKVKLEINVAKNGELFGTYDSAVAAKNAVQNTYGKVGEATGRVDQIVTGSFQQFTEEDGTKVNKAKIGNKEVIIKAKGKKGWIDVETGEFVGTNKQEALLHFQKKLGVEEKKEERVETVIRRRKVDKEEDVKASISEETTGNTVSSVISSLIRKIGSNIEKSLSSGSLKVVQGISELPADIQGKFAIFYHAYVGTYDKPSIMKSELGVHMAVDEELSSFFGDPKEYDVFMKNALRLKDEGNWDTGAATQLLDKGIISGKELSELLESEDLENYYKVVRDAILAAGYDGVVYTNRYEFGSIREENLGRQIEKKDPSLSIDQVKEILENSTDQELIDKYGARESIIVLDPSTVAGNKVLFSKEGTVQGLYVESTDTTYLIADGIKEGEEFNVLSHEVVHRESENLWKDPKSVFSAFVNSKDTGVQEAYEKAREANPNASESLLNEEALAYYIGKLANQVTSLGRRIIAAIKKMLINHFGLSASKLKPADLVSIYQQSTMRFREEKKARAGSDVKASRESVLGEGDREVDKRKEVLKSLSREDILSVIKENEPESISLKHKTLKTIEYLGKASSEILREANEKLFVDLGKMEMYINDESRKAHDAYSDFLRKVAGIKGDDKLLLDYVLSNRGSNLVAKFQEELFEQYEIDMTKVDEYLEKLEGDMGEAGLKIPTKIANYFPRRVKDMAGLKRVLADDPAYDVLKAHMEEMKREYKKKGIEWTDRHEEDIITAALFTGKLPRLLSLPGSTKERTINFVFPNITQYYYPAEEALAIHTNEAINAIAARKLIGKSAVRETQKTIDQSIIKVNEKTSGIKRREREISSSNDPKKISKLRAEIRNMNRSIDYHTNKIASLEGSTLDKSRELDSSIATHINELYERGELKGDREEIIATIRARILYKGMSKQLAVIRDIGVASALGSPWTSITQLGDNAWPIIRTGLGNTLQAVFGDKRVNSSLFDFTHSWREFSTAPTAKMVNFILKYNGLQLFDNFGKTVAMNAQINKYSKWTREKFIERWGTSYSNEVAGEIYDDMVSPSTDVNSAGDALRLFLFNSIMAYQPITLSNKPRAALEHPNGSIFYTLRGYGVQQLNNIIREFRKGLDGGPSKMKGGAIGMKNAAIMIGILALSGVGTDELKDLLSGKIRAEDLSDRFYENLLNIGFASRFSMDKAYREGAGTAFVSDIMGLPAKRALDAVSDLALKGKVETAWRIIPFFGQPTYEWWSTEGTEKRAKKMSTRISDEIHSALKSGRSFNKSKQLIREHNELAREHGINPINFRTRLLNAKRKLKEER